VRKHWCLIPVWQVRHSERKIGQSGRLCIVSETSKGASFEGITVVRRVHGWLLVVSRGWFVMRWLVRGVVLLLGLMVAGCSADFGPVAAFDGVIPAGVSPALQRGDKIKVTVYGEDNLNGIYDIDPSGSVSMPLAGQIPAAGRTKMELQHEISRKLKSEYLQDPKVTVEVAGFRPIYIIGEAEHPGEYPYRSGLNLLSAVTTAGGFTYRASRSYVLIQHAGEGVWRQYPLTAEVAIAPGDMIRIPERYF
jgi:Polysaccharide biosynthesis/export protein